MRHDKVSISSPVNKIYNLDIRCKVPSDLTISRMVKSNGISIYESKKDILYCPDINCMGLYTIGMYHWTKGLIECLVKLKKITRSEGNLHLEYATNITKQQEVDRDIKTLKSLEDKYGMIFLQSEIDSFTLENMIKEYNKKQARKVAEIALKKLV